MDAQAAATSLFDPNALTVVLVGTLLATVARAGLSDFGIALRGAAGLLGKAYDADANRTALARWAGDAHRRGMLGADQPDPPDRVLMRALNQLVRTGSITAFKRVHHDAAIPRRSAAARATNVFEQAGELAPVFGLVGTLFAMTQIAPGVGGDPAAATFAAIATAVLSSLYGVLSAHLVFLPLAGAVSRRSDKEAEARDTLVEWFCEEISDLAYEGPARAGLSTLKPAA